MIARIMVDRLVGAAMHRQVGLLVARDAEGADRARPADAILGDRARLPLGAKAPRLAGQQGVDRQPHAAPPRGPNTIIAAPPRQTPAPHRYQRSGFPPSTAHSHSNPPATSTPPHAA